MAKNYKTIALTGTEQKVVLAGQNCDIRNDSVDIVYASAEAGITSGADGVLSIPAGQAAKLLDCRGTLYILGTGSVMLCGNDYSELVFKAAASASGGGGVDQGARDTINAHVANEKIHLTAEKAIEAAATAISNPNLLINPDFQINQRGQAEYATAGYGYDRWRLGRSTGIVRAEGGKCTITATDTADPQHIFQTLENNYAGMTLTFAVTINNITDCTGAIHLVDKSFATIGSVINFAGAGRYIYTVTIPEDIDTLRLVIGFNTLANVGASFTFSALKLEPSSVPTPSIPPEPATELVKCQRCYEVLMDEFVDRNIIGSVNPTTRKAIFDIPFKVTKRIVPSLASGKVRLIVSDISTNTIVFNEVVDVTIIQADKNGMAVAAVIPDTVALTATCIASIDTRAADVPAFAVSADI